MLYAVLFATVFSLSELAAQEQWDQFVVDFNRHEQYGSDATEWSERYYVFKQNLVKIEEHNAKNLSWTLGVNQFADVTEEEFGIWLQWSSGYQLESKNKTRNYGKFDATTPMADSMDWDAKGKVTPVKNQGQCGSCWAFSTTGAIECRTAVSKNADPVSLSEQQLVDCSRKEGNQGCQGGLMDDGFEYVQQTGGLCSEDSYPYAAKNHIFCKATNDCNGKYEDPISGHKDVTPDSSTAMISALQGGCVSIAIEADKSAFQLYKGGVLTSTACGTQLDHGVLVVGYGTDGSNDYWKVKNS